MKRTVWMELVAATLSLTAVVLRFSQLRAEASAVWGKIETSGAQSRDVRFCPIFGSFWYFVLFQKGVAFISSG